MVIHVRAEIAADHEQVRELNRQAFGRPGEGALVDTIRDRPGVISLAATHEGVVLGHILFSPVQIDGPASEVSAAGLGPMAVLPGHQRSGIGSQLVQQGLERCRQCAYEIVVVLGHPRFYPRFGFPPASHHGLRYESPVPDEVFMALELTPGALAAGGGVVRYLPEFAKV